LPHGRRTRRRPVRDLSGGARWGTRWGISMVAPGEGSRWWLQARACDGTPHGGPRGGRHAHGRKIKRGRRWRRRWRGSADTS
jgi:hypothetical protein